MEQGSVLRHEEKQQVKYRINGLNPFGTGQCLTTLAGKLPAGVDRCLNPFGTGQCLTTIGTQRETA